MIFKENKRDEYFELIVVEGMPFVFVRVCETRIEFLIKFNDKIKLID